MRCVACGLLKSKTFGHWWCMTAGTGGSSQLQVTQQKQRFDKSVSQVDLKIAILILSEEALISWLIIVNIAKIFLYLCVYCKSSRSAWNSLRWHIYGTLSMSCMIVYKILTCLKIIKTKQNKQKSHTIYVVVVVFSWGQKIKSSRSVPQKTSLRWCSMFYDSLARKGGEVCKISTFSKHL